MSTQPPSSPTASAIGPCPTIIKNVGRPGTGFGWLVVLGLNGPLRQHFSLYRAVFQREGESWLVGCWLVVLGLTAL